MSLVLVIIEDHLPSLFCRRHRVFSAFAVHRRLVLVDMSVSATLSAIMSVDKYDVAISIVTMVSMIAALVMRFSNPAQRIISTFDDWFSWFVTFMPVLTGVIATSHLGARYETLLAIHILSVALLLVWLPFGKLMHFLLVFVTRSQTGAHLSHRGAQQI